MRNTDKINFMSQDEISRFFKAIKGKRDKIMFLIAYRHGLRASEVGLLRVGDVDLEHSRLRVHRLKGSIGGMHRLQADELRLLKAYMKSLAIKDGCLFPSNRKQPISRRNLDYLMKGYCKRANIAKEKSHFHVLKHSIATHLIEAQMGIEFVQDWLGHRYIENTLIYASITNRSRDNGADIAFSRLEKM